EEVFVKVPLHVLVLRGDFHGLNGAARFYEQARLVDLEFGVGHVFAERAGLATEVFEEGEDLLLHVLEGFLGGKLAPVRPTEFLALVALGKERLKLLAASSGALGVLLAFVELLQKEKKRELFDGVERIGKAAGPELVPERVNLGAELGVG